jgi:MerR family transcriptional regulator, copper efflux regulator
MKIGEAARRSGVPPKTIRYYEQRGVLPEPRRAANGYRDYDQTVVRRLGFVRRAQATGLTLAEIRSIVDVRENGDPPCGHVRALIDLRAAEIDRHIDELRVLRGELTRLASRARELDPADCDADSVCRIITG